MMPPLKPGRKTIHAQYLLIAGLMFAPLLSGCSQDKPVEQRGCDDPEVQTLAKKQVAMYFDEKMRQKNPARRQMDALMRRPHEDTKTALNTSKSKHIDPNGVTLVEVTQVQSPANKKSTGAQTGFEEFLFICSAKARIKLDPAALDKVTDSILAPDGLDVEGDTIAQGIIFMTKAAADRRLQVSMMLRDPILDLLMRTLQQNTVPNPRQ